MKASPHPVVSEEKSAVAERLSRIRRRGFYTLLRQLCITHHALTAEVLGTSRERNILHARHALFCALYDALGSSPAAAKVFGCDHTTVLNALKKRAAAARARVGA